MARITIAPGLITFEDADGTRRSVTPEKLEDAVGEGDELAYLSALVNFGMFFQLVEVNGRLGQIDMETKEGRGLLGLTGQMTLSLIEVSERMGRLATAFEAIQAQTAQGASGADVSSIMDAAMAKVTAMMGAAGASVTPPPSGNGSSKG